MIAGIAATAFGIGLFVSGIFDGVGGTAFCNQDICHVQAGFVSTQKLIWGFVLGTTGAGLAAANVPR